MEYFVINGGRKLSGCIEVNSSKNAAVALLAASLINKGVTTLLNVPQIEEVNRWLEVLESIGVGIVRKGHTIVLTPPRKLKLGDINKKSAKKTRSVILLLGALLRRQKKFSLPQAGGCRLGARTVTPHLYALEKFGVSIDTKRDAYEVDASKLAAGGRVVLYESGDTVTENAIFAAAQMDGVTEIRFASANYMVQDVCFFLQKLGVKISGIGTTTLIIHGNSKIDKDVSYSISEDPIEAMLFLSLAITTKSELTIKRCPIDFLELELEKLAKMGVKFDVGEEYKSYNKKTALVDIVVYPSELRALPDKIHALPFPGINMDNLPFFVPIAALAKGQTLIHDWVYENRAIYFSALNQLGAQVTLMDPHRVAVNGVRQFVAAEMVSPPALRPAAIMLVAMVAAPGQSVLRNVYPINRGYENLPERLRDIGVDIELMVG